MAAYCKLKMLGLATWRSVASPSSFCDHVTPPSVDLKIPLGGIDGGNSRPRPANPLAVAAGFVNAEKEVADAAAALEGARAILVEKFAEDADLIGALRERMWGRGRLVSKVRDGKAEDGAKFADYFDFAEPLTKLPSHRILAMFRGEKEEVLDVTLEPEEGDGHEVRIAARFGVADGRVL